MLDCVFYDIRRSDDSLGNRIDPSELSLFELSRVRLVYSVGNGRERRVYIGRFLFPERSADPKQGGITDDQAIYDGYKINRTSLRKDRVGLVVELVEQFLDGNLALGKAQGIVGAMNWVDCESGYTAVFDDRESMLQLYTDYSEHLWEHVRQRNVNAPQGKIRRNTAVSNQINMAAIVSLSIPELSEDQVKESAIRIQQRRGEDLFHLSLDSAFAHRVAAIHRYLFLQIFNFLINKESFPLVIPEEKKIGVKKQIFASNQVQNIHGLADPMTNSATGKMWSVVIDPDGNIRRWETIQSLEGFKNAIQREKDRVEEIFQSMTESNTNTELTDWRRKKLFNSAIHHFCHGLLHDTGANPAVLNLAPMIKAKHMDREGKFRVMTVKNRAGKEYPLKINPQFASYWDRMLELSRAAFGDITNWVGIHCFSKNGPANLSKTMLIKRNTSLWSESYGWVNPGVWRKYSTNTHLNETGDISHSAAQHSHTEETAARHYIAVKNGQAVAEMYNFFSGLERKVGLYAGNLIPVQIVEPDTPAGTTGRCISEGAEAEKTEGYTNAAQAPRCTAMLTCFFCKHYGIHASIDDIVLLLSIREWLPIHSRKMSRNMDEHLEKYEPLIARVDDIVTDFSGRSERYAEIVNEAKQQIEDGNLNPYWGAKIDAMEAAGIVMETRV